ncbi:MAG: VWA domain-containing protein [Ruminococcaceae bacterium]|nr:VWA domain-containing protein [Oscillospiraceae bacterium]
MKTYPIHSANLFTPAVFNHTMERIRVLEDDGLHEDAEQLRECLVLLMLDTSGSMGIHEEDMYEAVQETLMSLAKQNKTDLKISFRVKIVTFNDDVHEFNSTPLPPEQLAEIFTREQLRCHGGTNLSAAIRYLDVSRTNPMVTNRKKGDYKIIAPMITDFAGTDDAAVRKQATERINHNRLVKQLMDVICVYVGNEKDKNEAVLLAGSADNIIALDKDLSRRLAPTMIKTTLTYVDPTHTDYDVDNQTPAAVGKQAVERQEEGMSTAEDFTQKKLEQKIDDLLGNGLLGA